MSDEPVSEAALQALQHELSIARAELQDFTYAVSHDLRAPLRHIDAFAQVIAEDWPGMPAEMAGHLATIQRAAQLLARQLDGLTTLSRLGLQPLNLQAVDVGALAQEAAAEVACRYPQHPLQWRLATDVPTLLADAALLRQVLAHVLDNAVKFSVGQATPAMTQSKREPQQTPGAPAPAPPAPLVRVALTWCTLGDGRCQISVQDHGIGFDPAQAQALFKPFGRLHPARDFPGLGLGLVACRKILRRLGGEIDIHGAPGEGCCVAMTLPRR